jgi:hypothetical protein
VHLPDDAERARILHRDQGLGQRTAAGVPHTTGDDGFWADVLPLAQDNIEGGLACSKHRDRSSVLGDVNRENDWSATGELRRHEAERIAHHVPGNALPRHFRD